MMKEAFSQIFLEGVSDYYWNRNNSPKWITLQVHYNEWKRGWQHARERDLNIPTKDSKDPPKV